MKKHFLYFMSVALVALTMNACKKDANEALSGKCIYKDEKGIERTKPLITVDEIRVLPENRSLIISSNKPIIKGFVSPYWRNLRFRRYAKMSPVPFTGEIPNAPVALIKV